MRKVIQPVPRQRRQLLFPYPLLQGRSVMFERLSQAAEKMATNVSVSRRGFLGRLGTAAAGTTGALGALLLFSGRAQAGALPSGTCVYYVEGVCGPMNKVSKDCNCPPSHKGCRLSYCFPNF